MEFANILVLLFNPSFKYANGVGVFKLYEKSKETEIYDFVEYLVKWVAGTKLIFIALMIVILAFGNEKMISFMALAMAISILSFYWKLYLLIRKIVQNEQIETKNYSKTLAIMIGAMIIAFLIGFILYFIPK
ncbi:MAG: hypothetical protein ACTSWC_13980 [Promethearchaeota archaeon]